MPENRRQPSQDISSQLSLETRFHRARKPLAKGEEEEKESAALVPVNPTTFNHHFKGRKLDEQPCAEMQALSPEEEQLLLG